MLIWCPCLLGRVDEFRLPWFAVSSSQEPGRDSADQRTTAVHGGRMAGPCHPSGAPHASGREPTPAEGSPVARRGGGCGPYRDVRACPAQRVGPLGSRPPPLPPLAAAARGATMLAPLPGCCVARGTAPLCGPSAGAGPAAGRRGRPSHGGHAAQALGRSRGGVALSPDGSQWLSPKRCSG
jgi:hypothetical protein